MNKLIADLSYGFKGEDNVADQLRKKGWNIECTENVAIHDFIAEDNEGTRWSLELKTRRCSKDTYEDTMIGANKVGEAYNIYYKKGMETLFLFQYDDGLFYINPLANIGRLEWKAGRWDRGKIDGKKGWIYYKTNLLIKI